MSAATMTCRRSSRSTSTPATGPNSTDGSSRASMTPATARPPREAPPFADTSVATATKPTQSPSDETSMARQRRENDGWRRRSFSPAGLVPRRAAISSATVATGSVCYPPGPSVSDPD